MVSRLAIGNKLPLVSLIRLVLVLESEVNFSRASVGLRLSIDATLHDVLVLEIRPAILQRWIEWVAGPPPFLITLQSTSAGGTTTFASVVVRFYRRAACLCVSGFLLAPLPLHASSRIIIRAASSGEW